MTEYFPYQGLHADVTLGERPNGLHADIELLGVGRTALLRHMSQPDTVILTGPVLDDDSLIGSGADLRLFEQTLQVARSIGAQTLTSRIQDPVKAQLFRLIPGERLSFAELVSISRTQKDNFQVEVFHPVRASLRVITERAGMPTEVPSGRQETVKTPTTFMVNARLYGDMADPYDEV